MSNPMEDTSTIVCLPMKLDAFRLNNSACDSPSRLAPLTQPDYTNFRIDDDEGRVNMKHDVLQPVDLHNTGLKKGSAFNDRVVDLTTGLPIRSRHGICIHWILPRFYRTSLSATHSTSNGNMKENLRNNLGYEHPLTDDPDSPLYRSLPSRWVVVRHVTGGKRPPQLPEYEAFVVESDRLRKLAELKSNVDIQVDVSPFIHISDLPKLPTERSQAVGEIHSQGENFIGFKQLLKDWEKEEEEEEEVIARVKLWTANTFNPIFTDYQPHNSTVFSLLDNFAYTDGGQTKYADGSLMANYYVVGWHYKENEDPFHDFNPERLKAYFKLKDDDENAGVYKYFELANEVDPSSITKNSRLVIHGAIYDVSWDLKNGPMNDSGKDVGDLYEGHMLEGQPGFHENYSPVAVGGSPLDALIAIMHANHYEDHPKDPDPVPQDLIAVQTLVDKLEEDPDSQLEGIDALHNSCFIPSDGGLRWHVTGTTDANQPIVPPESELNDLKMVNGYQLFVDLCIRKLKSVQWLIWAEWWKWTTRRERGEEERKRVQGIVRQYVISYNMIKGSADQTNGKIANITDRYKQKWESVPLPRYYIPKDPTVLLCGMKNPWPSDWTNLLAVRVDSQLVDVPTSPPDHTKFDEFRKASVPKFPTKLQDTVGKLLAEFYNLGVKPPREDLKNPLPLYHDAPDPDAPDPKITRDNWNETQAWFPLFVEWEIEYLHIHKDLWGLEERKAYGPPMLRSKIVDSQKIDRTNIRVLSGREIIVPQVSKMLGNAVEKLLKNKPAKAKLDKNLRKDIQDILHKIPFLNITLSGIRDQLATRLRGTHISPTIYNSSNPDGGLPLQEAIAASQGVFDEEALRLINDTTVTPFGNFSNYGSTTSPFKPVTHGQFRFTKLNVIDKFGRALCAINPQRGADDRTSKLYPYISEIYATDGIPSSFSSDQLNWDAGEILYIAPSINQFSRINGHYVEWDDHNKWVPATEYDNPIWGWLVVNYVDRGLQVFLPDGTFYREIRLGKGETSTSVEWLPFEDPGTEVPNRQLRELLNRLKSTPQQLQEIFNAINEALDCDALTYAHNLYAGYLPSITGRPLALVNTGWSLELSHPFYTNQSISNRSDEPGLEKYEFPIKLGDRERTFDGVVGYFRQGRSEESPYNFDKFYTYFVKEDPKTTDLIKTTELIEPQNYPKLTPYYNSPLLDEEETAKIKAKDPATIVKEYNNKLDIFAMLVDPFTAIHGYTTCQPVKELQLPHWSLEQALGRITAFFHMGPVIMPSDAPGYDRNRKLASGSDWTEIDRLLKGVSPFPVPSVTIADWAWLQPYYHDRGTEEEEGTSFNPFPVTAIKRPPEFNQAPYTAVEGYLYLKTPITEPEPVPVRR